MLQFRDINNPCLCQLKVLLPGWKASRKHISHIQQHTTKEWTLTARQWQSSGRCRLPPAWPTSAALILRVCPSARTSRAGESGMRRLFLYQVMTGAGMALDSQSRVTAVPARTLSTVTGAPPCALMLGGTGEGAHTQFCILLEQPNKADKPPHNLPSKRYYLRKQ